MIKTNIKHLEIPLIWLKIIVAVQLLSRVQLSGTSWTAWVCLSFTISQSSLNSGPLSQCWRPTVSSSVASFSFCPQPFPAPGSFPRSQLFTSGGQSIGASVSASVFPLSNIKYFFFLSLFFRKRAILVLLTWAYCSSLNLWTCLLPNIYLLIWENNFLENI